MDEKSKNSPISDQHHEKHQEESEVRQEGGDANSSWQRVMKVTKKTERTSKTEHCTKTYKVVGSGEDKRLVECSIKEGDEKGDKLEVKDEKNPFVNEEKNEEPTEVEEVEVKKTKKKCCPCCSKCVLS